MPYADPEARRAHDKLYRLDNKAKIQAKNHHYYAANKDTLKEKDRLRNAANQDKAKERNRVWHAANQEHVKQRKHNYYIAHTDALGLIYQAYRQSHPEIHRMADKTRRARKRQAPVNDLTAAQWLEIQATQDHRCSYCGKRCKGKLTQDHIIPLSNGGSHTLHNVIGACNTCNAKKNVGPPPVPVQPLLLTMAPAKRPQPSSIRLPF